MTKKVTKPTASVETKDLVKEELREVYKQFKNVHDKAKAGLLDRIVKRELKAIDTSKLEALLKDE